MLKKILKVITIILASWGILFIIILLIPDNEEDSTDALQTVAEESAEEESGEEKEPEEESSPGYEEETAEAPEEESSTGSEEETAEASEEDREEASEASGEAVQAEASEEAVQAEASGEEDSGTFAEAVQGALGEAVPGEDSGREEGGNTVHVNIPESEISGETFSFRSMSLDNKVVTGDIFKDYDLTVVHVWGTYCGPCIAEMKDYAELYRELPDNVNLVGFVLDVYDGLDNNVDAAHEILDDAGAEFTNIRTSDSNFYLLSSFQYIPSSFFVDREGRIVGELMDGGFFGETRKRLESYLE